MIRTDSGPPSPVHPGLLVGIVLVAVNLRVGLTCVGPLIPAVSDDTGLSSAAAGLLSTLPLLAFAVISPAVPRWSRRRASTSVITAALLGILVGTALRSAPALWALFAGTLVLSAGIAAGNVLLPATIKSVAPAHRVGPLTSLYVTAMGLSAAVSSAVAVPIAQHTAGGWRTALGAWTALALLALAAWKPLLHRAPAPSGTLTARAAPAASPSSPWRSALAWQVACFMGLQSLGFYTVIAWLPSVLREHGTSPGTAGWQLFVMQTVGLAAGAAVPLLTRLCGNQRLPAAGASLVSAAGYAGVLLMPAWATVWSAVLGIGAGSCLVLALTFQAHRAADAAAATALSGMAQAVGYAIAAVGPILAGYLHDTTGSWTPPLVMLTTLACLQAAAGAGAGRDLPYATDRSENALPPKQHPATVNRKPAEEQTDEDG
ncbi:MFS transporter [Streptomyces klenkii]|uniref:CynX/NimT family MFS transporter n=1 Tax=Streptomyces klenkii TaxID=1420899 RepID=UPI0033A36035